ncbi:metallophosphoesterase [Pseudorhodoferax sp. Leaf265]|uniref:metallophosphoesterase n=1 Tax=Pseudorhodoferax sp. Leaf265 TaxID=1736315 RepID=UPI0006F729D6|nr:metallophosphoesterase [Pseudorhodoferax sp. Leaf265]KQP03539.1 metallophosphoesterase [Pseudorhodoferax sp. Leaf265]
MKFQLLSDLHLERQPHFVASPAKGVDVLVLAGDIGSYQEGSLLSSDDFGLTAFSPKHSPWKTVVYVPGNHEYDQQDFSRTHEKLRRTCQKLDILMLEREAIVIDGVRFLGTTLWSDFDALALQVGLAVPPSLPEVLRNREKAFRAANFYLRKYSTLYNDAPVLADGIRELGLECQRWLDAELRTNHHGKTVVVTHFAPSLLSADPRYGRTPGTAGFCNSLDELFPYADVWAHGHLHCPNEYQVGRCRVVSNPLGYLDKGEQEFFIPEYVVEV